MLNLSVFLEAQSTLIFLIQYIEKVMYASDIKCIMYAVFSRRPMARQVFSIVCRRFRTNPPAKKRGIARNTLDGPAYAQ